MADSRPERVGVLSSRSVAPDGRRRLTMPDGSSVLVPAELTPQRLALSYGLDRVVIAPAVDFCPGLHMDGPLAGRIGYAVNEIGSRGRYFLPPYPVGGPAAVYEVMRLADGDRPAEMRFVGFSGLGGAPISDVQKG